MRSDRRWLLAMIVFVVVCLSVPFWARPRDQAGPAPTAPETRVGAVEPTTRLSETVAREPSPKVVRPPTKPKAPMRESYYMILFASDPPSNLARESHTFATFARTKLEDVSDYLESHTISWLPASLVIVPLRSAEKGKNLSLEETFAWAKSLNSRLAAWGPYEIKKELYDRSQQQFERLQKGEVMYKMLDVRFRPNMAINCIHAVCDVAPAEMLLTGSASGEAAGWMVANYLRPWIVHTSETADWLTNHLGLADYNINYRKLEIVQAASP